MKRFSWSSRARKLIVLEKAEGNGFLRAAPRLGSHVPVHATAAGKLYLAHAPELVELGELTRYTIATVRARKALQAEVDAARARGYAVNREEWQPGLAVVAAPVFVQSRLHGVAALAMVTARAAAIGERSAARRVQHAAEGIALRLEGGSI